MAKTVIGLFEDQSRIQQVIQELERQGFQRQSLQMYGSGAQGGQQRLDPNMLAGAGVPSDDANIYAEGVRRGGTLIKLSTRDEQADTAYEIMQRYGAVDIDGHSAHWRQEGWSNYDANSQPYNTQQVEEYRTNYSRQNQQGEAVLPVMQEELQVGKQQVQRGGVRVYSEMTEQPVQEQVQLREEHVNVERRPVNRAVSEADVNAFREGSFEVTETAEVPVVSKQARVVEEVAIGKEVQERTETVSDTVRRTDVQVEQTGGNSQTYRDTETYTDRDRR